MHTLIAMTRDVSPSLANCELSFVDRGPIDPERAAAQHQDYRNALRALGCKLLELPMLPEMPDAVFVEDMAVVLDEVAIVTRAGATSRRGESQSVADALMPYRTAHAIQAPGTLEGGDVVRIGRTLYVGQAARSNADGIAQLRSLLAPYDYRVEAVPTHGCLHLKSAVSVVADGMLLVQPAWVDTGLFANHRLIEIDPEEEHAANALRIGDSVIHPACFPRTRQRLRAAGITVVPVDISELQKAEGAVTCCSLVFSESLPSISR
ncbi:MAG: arginine deiminase-related protein [Luteimonas sp.]